MNVKTKTMMLDMIDDEIDQTNKNISNYKLWALGSDSEEDSAMFTENIVDLEDFKRVLLEMREKVVNYEPEGSFW